MMPIKQHCGCSLATGLKLAFRQRSAADNCSYVCTCEAAVPSSNCLCRHSDGCASSCVPWMQSLSSARPTLLRLPLRLPPAPARHRPVPQGNGGRLVLKHWHGSTAHQAVHGLFSRKGIRSISSSQVGQQWLLQGLLACDAI